MRTEVEQHPWAPFVPDNARILFLGTFPPKPNRWGMDFYYPNKINDFWRIIGKIIFDDYSHFINPNTNGFDKKMIIETITKYGIALGDTGQEVRRLKDNASDKFLEIVTPIDIFKILNNTTLCNTIVSTGQKAAEVIAQLTNTTIPPMGKNVSYLISNNRAIKIYRMPSTSRAYPLSIEKKTEYYRNLLLENNIVLNKF